MNLKNARCNNKTNLPVFEVYILNMRFETKRGKEFEILNS
jgi:hypothetical protein